MFVGECWDRFMYHIEFMLAPISYIIVDNFSTT